MKVIIETQSPAELEQLLLLLRQLGIGSFQVVEKEEPARLPVTEGDKSIDPTDLFGIWKEEPRTIGDIRAKGWNRN